MASSANMHLANPPKPLGSTCTILKEALLLSKKNPTLISSIFFISLLGSSLYFSGYQLSIYPLLTDLTDKAGSIAAADPSTPAYRALLAAIYNDIKELTAIEVVFLLVALAITFVLKTITIYALAVTHTGKLLTLKELLCKVKGMLKGPVITQLYVSVLSLGYMVLLIAFVILLLYVSNGSVLLIGLVVLVSLVAIVVYLYLVTLWSTSITVSVVEQGCRGAAATKRAGELIRGRKREGVSIVVVAVVLALAVSGVYSLAFAALPRGIWSKLGVGLVYNVEIEVVNLFVLAAITVYYYECRRSRGEEEDSINGSFGYTSLPTTDADVVERN